MSDSLATSSDEPDLAQAAIRAEGRQTQHDTQGSHSGDDPVVNEVAAADSDGAGSDAAGDGVDVTPPERPSKQDGAPVSRRVRLLPPPPVAESSSSPPAISDDDISPPDMPRWRRFVLGRSSISFNASFLFHLGLLFALALMIEADKPTGLFDGLVGDISVPIPLDSRDDDPAQPDPSEQFSLLHGMAAADSVDVVEIDITHPGDTSREKSGAQTEAVTSQSLTPADMMLRTPTAVGRGGLDGRGPQTRANLVQSGGGTRQSERAVEMGLRWLVVHQRDDGSWNFDHTKSRCKGLCRNPGKESSTTAATGLALLPFLGAGYTHADGPYQEDVKRGLYYLKQKAMMTEHGFDLQEGTMYAQGIATIALCEAYGMTKDETLRPFAQKAIDYIVFAQDPKGGGWRYRPHEPGDTTVTGWQLMALKSGYMAGLTIPSPTIHMAQRFLTSVQSYDGAQYGYMDPRPRKTTTAIGLLMRMYAGWPRTSFALNRGVEFLSDWGPTEDNLYHNYYATQVLRHWEGPLWDRWNEEVREHLIATQATAGHESGSWYFAGGYGDQGGRLYNTAMAVMILEVYYRYMPLYRESTVETGF